MESKKTQWAQYNINYYFVWKTKYRKKIFAGKVADKLEELIYRIVGKLGGEIIFLSIQPDHLHLMVSAPPRCSPAYLANNFKGYTARELFRSFPELRTEEKHLWTRTYYVGTAGNISEEVINNYMEDGQDD